MNVAAFRSNLPTRRRCVGHPQRYLHCRIAGSCCPSKEPRKLATLPHQSLRAWSLLVIEKSPYVPAASSGAGFLRSNSLILVNCCPRCSSPRQSKNASRTIVGVKAGPFLQSVKLGVEVSIYSPEFELSNWE